MTTLAAILVILVALFPTDQSGVEDGTLVGKIHMCSAISCISLFAVYTLLLFPKTDPVKAGYKEGKDQFYKNRRNNVYRCLGGASTALAIAFTVSTFLPQAESGTTVFWLEAFSLTFIGVAWIVKADTMLNRIPITRLRLFH
ncbi:hypothetical protein ACFLXY_09310 [Chloroflexota bacterium]